MRKAMLAIASVMAMATAASPASAIQCVAYAREVSGINLKGDAWQWWSAAAGQYDRGNNPRSGAVLVFDRQGSMSHGHVSVVTRVINSRTILVDHANWAPVRTSGRGAVSTSVPLIDVSPRNDWSQVRVWYNPTQDYGTRVYRTEGFVYRPQSNHLPQHEGFQLAAMGQSVMPKPEAPVKRAPVVEASKPVSAAIQRPQARPVQTALPVSQKTVKAEAHQPAPPAVENTSLGGTVTAAKQIYQNRTPQKQGGLFN